MDNRWVLVREAMRIRIRDSCREAAQKASKEWGDKVREVLDTTLENVAQRIAVELQNSSINCDKLPELVAASLLQDSFPEFRNKVVSIAKEEANKLHDQFVQVLQEAAVSAAMDLFQEMAEET